VKVIAPTQGAAITMTTGTVKWFNPTKGFGFIEPNDGSKDAFVHISAVERAGLSSLSEGQKVEYELVPGRDGKSSAENLVVLD
jgi:CspA family cold shock protein